jgi:1,2-phenylacetyl-CoA epoxidase catalytic subunit
MARGQRGLHQARGVYDPLGGAARLCDVGSAVRPIAAQGGNNASISGSGVPQPSSAEPVRRGGFCGNAVNASAVLAWCDDLFIQSQMLARWITDYVDLEESLAVGTLAQESLAHGVALLGAAGLGAAERDKWIFEREAHEWYPSRVGWSLTQDWSDTVARRLLLARGVLVMRRHVKFSDRQPSQQLLSLIYAEQELHCRHWERWLTVLARDPLLRRELNDHLVGAYDDATDLFGWPASSPEGDEMLIGDPPAMREEWAREVCIIVEKLGLIGPGLDTPVDPRASAAGLPGFADFLAVLTEARGPGGVRRYEVYR